MSPAQRYKCSIHKKCPTCVLSEVLLQVLFLAIFSLTTRKITLVPEFEHSVLSIFFCYFDDPSLNVNLEVLGNNGEGGLDCVKTKCLVISKPLY